MTKTKTIEEWVEELREILKDCAHNMSASNLGLETIYTKDPIAFFRQALTTIQEERDAWWKERIEGMKKHCGCGNTDLDRDWDGNAECEKCEDGHKRKSNCNWVFVWDDVGYNQALDDLLTLPNEDNK